MFLIDTSSIILLIKRRKCFIYPYAIPLSVIKELYKKNINIDCINSPILIISISYANKTADQEINTLKRIYPYFKVVSEDYHLRKKTQGISVKKLLCNF